MDGGRRRSGAADAVVDSLHDLIEDIGRISAAGGFGVLFRKDCTDLCRRISLLSHLVDEIRDLGVRGPDCRPTSDESSSSPPSSPSPTLSHLLFALRNAKRLLLVAGKFDSGEDGAAKKIAFKFQCVMWKLEKALSNIPFEEFGISEEVQEQVELVTVQLRRAVQKYGPTNSALLSRASSQPLLCEDSDVLPLGTIQIDITSDLDHMALAKSNSGESSKNQTSDFSSHGSETGENSSASYGDSSSEKTDRGADNEAKTSIKLEETRKLDSVDIPEDFLCPVSLEIMRDPVIVATGQTYERSYIQRWIDSGNVTCPKTQQKLENFTLTPNYVLRSLISQWCTKHNVEQPTAMVTGKIKKRDGSFRDVSGDIAAIRVLVGKLLNRSRLEECQSAVREIRALSKRSTDNRILIAEAGAIPVLVNLLTTDDILIQENAVTSILNLSIYESNRRLIMLAGAIPSIVHVLKNGSMEARENAAATLFSLSLADENKMIIGGSGAVPALVELLQNGSPRGKRDAATALFNLCIYQGNKGRAVRAGIIAVLLKMLTESNGTMVDEALTILSVIAGHPEAQVAIVKAGTLPVLVELMRTGLPRNKENAAAILLALCKRDTESLALLERLGSALPLMDLAMSGTERAQRKATSLLELLRRFQQL